MASTGIVQQVVPGLELQAPPSGGQGAERLQLLLQGHMLGGSRLPQLGPGQQQLHARHDRLQGALGWQAWRGVVVRIQRHWVRVEWDMIDRSTLAKNFGSQCGCCERSHAAQIH